MSTQGERRQSGRTQAEEEAQKAGEELDGVEEVVSTDPKERRSRFNVEVTLGRMRTDWRGGDLEVIQSAQNRIDEIIGDQFWEFYAIYYAFLENVREPETVDGEVQTDHNGRTIWRTYPKGHPMHGVTIENWSELTAAEMRNLLGKLLSHLEVWRARAIRIRTEATFARALYEGVFAEGFESLPPDKGSKRLPTVEDREQRAKRIALEDRMFALFQTALSYQADSVVRSAEQLHDTMLRLLTRS